MQLFLVYGDALSKETTLVYGDAGRSSSIFKSCMLKPFTKKTSQLIGLATLFSTRFSFNQTQENEIIFQKFLWIWNSWQNK